MAPSPLLILVQAACLSYVLHYFLTMETYADFDRILSNVHDDRYSSGSVHLFELDHLPRAAHNGQVMVLHRTEFDFIEFLRFTAEKASTNELGQQALSILTNPEGSNKLSEGFDVIQMREVLSQYCGSKIRYIGRGEREQQKRLDHSRWYYSYKGVKDFILLARDSKVDLTWRTVKSDFFERGALLNYINTLVATMVEQYFTLARSVDPNPKQDLMPMEEVLVEKTKDFDISQYFVHELLAHGTQELLLEDLEDFTNFEPCCQVVNATYDSLLVGPQMAASRFVETKAYPEKPVEVLRSPLNADDCCFGPFLNGLHRTLPSEGSKRGAHVLLMSEDESKVISSDYSGQDWNFIKNSNGHDEQDLLWSSPPLLWYHPSKFQWPSCIQELFKDDYNETPLRYQNVVRVPCKDGADSGAFADTLGVLPGEGFVAYISIMW